ncbi:EamA family transporter [Thermodesulfobacteriota bacterium]
MRAEGWAVLTALCWGVGSLLEKRGVNIGGLTPIMGTAIRTTVSLLLLLAVSFPFWGQIKTAGAKSISLIAIGGGIMAGGLGIVFLYTGLKSGNLSTVMTIAFCLAPVVGTALGFIVLGEKLTGVQILGIALCVIGATLVTYFKQV